MEVVNVRLQSVLRQRGVSPEQLAELCQVDPKTVGRWVGGRVPRPRHRRNVAEYLCADEQFLWPTGDEIPREPDGSELIGTYLNRAEVPREQWLSLLTEATEQIDLLVFSGTFIAQTNPRIATMLAAQAAQGVRGSACASGTPTEPPW